MPHLKDLNSAFANRHIGPQKAEIKEMISAIGFNTVGDLINKVIPKNIRLSEAEHIKIDGPYKENDLLDLFKEKAQKNKVYTSYIGQGYYDTIVPTSIQRNLFENPGWYSSYTPYQAEIAQGRLESLINFQTMVSDLTGLPIANAGLLDEGTAAAEAMAMLFNHKNRRSDAVDHHRFFVDAQVFEQTKEVISTRALPIGIEVVVDDFNTISLDDSFFGALVQYPDKTGSIHDYRSFIEKAAALNIKTIFATDLLALTLLVSPGELGADVAIGSSQRFGVPMGFGGPHSAFFATKDEFKRNIPGRIIGASVDADGNMAYRMALQTREQHIRREKATSNICTAQALLANMAAMYAVYHGPDGLKQIASKINHLTGILHDHLKAIGYDVLNKSYFDTITIRTDLADKIRSLAEAKGINFFFHDLDLISISVGESIEEDDIFNIISIFSEAKQTSFEKNTDTKSDGIPDFGKRTSSYMEHPVFHTHHSETEFVRYLKKLENKDLSLVHSMISLGSCTMKLNSATELIPVSWPEFANIHPFAPQDQTKGYIEIITELEDMLSSITQMSACSLQPNSGAQGEFTGLLAIKKYHEANGGENRNIVLIPISAHGTNPASAVMAGCKVVIVKCDDNGDINIDDLREKAEQNKENLAAMMVTYPSTYGVFEEGIEEICQIVHDNGGLVYMDGANMNAQAGFTAPGRIGADVCHLNLHKTFAIPHGGGGPGVGPICVNEKLKPYLPPKSGKGQVSSAPYGSANILLISYAYLKLLGLSGLQQSTEMAILNANYLMHQLSEKFKILYTGTSGYCAHEFIVDLRPFKDSTGVTAEDIAKRLMDYGFHAPTVSFPVPGTFMIEPTESENKAELDRFCEAMNQIYSEIKEIESGAADKDDNVLKNAPHTAESVIADDWKHEYSRNSAAFPLAWIKERKFWPSVRRVNNSIGDRNLICTCPPVESYEN